MEIYVSKSGTNWYHGTAFLNMRRDIWNANAWARNASTNPATSFRPKERHQRSRRRGRRPGFHSESLQRQGQDLLVLHLYDSDCVPASIGFPLSTVPTAAMKQGNFSQLGSQLIYDPATTVGTTRQPFPGNLDSEGPFQQGIAAICFP